LDNFIDSSQDYCIANFVLFLIYYLLFEMLFYLEERKWPASLSVHLISFWRRYSRAKSQRAFRKRKKREYKKQDTTSDL